MMRAGKDGTMISFLVKPLLVVTLLVSLFGLVWLRSSITAVKYELHSLEEEKTEALKKMKMLLAAKADHMSIGKISTAFRENIRGDSLHARNESYFQNRVKVIHIKRSKEVVPYRTSLQGGTEGIR